MYLAYRKTQPQKTKGKDNSNLLRVNIAWIAWITLVFSSLRQLCAAAGRETAASLIRSLSTPLTSPTAPANTVVTTMPVVTPSYYFFSLCTHMSVLVHVVVGELDLVECDVTLHPVGSAGRAVGMHVQPIQLYSSNRTVLL